MAKKGVFFMMLGDHIQCISEEISFKELCVTLRALLEHAIMRLQGLMIK